MYGSQTTEGIITCLERRYRQSSSEAVKAELEALMSSKPCPECHADRLKPIALAVTVGGINIMDFCRKSVSEAIDFIDNLSLSAKTP